MLASVPWLDDSNVQQKELKGVAMVGLLGTLEEVGFNIRAQVLRIWAGEGEQRAHRAEGLYVGLGSADMSTRAHGELGICQQGCCAIHHCTIKRVQMLHDAGDAALPPIAVQASATTP